MSETVDADLNGALAEVVFLVRALESRIANSERVNRELAQENQTLSAWNRRLFEQIHGKDDGKAQLVLS